MNAEKTKDAVREYLKTHGFEKYNIDELTAHFFWYVSGYSPDMILSEAYEILRQIEIEWKIERKRNNERI